MIGDRMRVEQATANRVAVDRTTTATGASRSSGLDGLRAAACIAVVLFHTHNVANVSFGPLDPFVVGGNTGVWVFFALSGYLLYRPFLTRPVDLKTYALKRAARILPAYYVALIALVVLVGSRLPAENPVAYLTITASYDGSLRTFLGPAWTLAAEVLFYVTLPLIARVAAGREVIVLVTLGALSMVGSVVQRYTATEANVFYLSIFPYVFFAFVPGMLMAVLEVRMPAAFKELARPQYLLMGLLFLAIGTLTSIYPLPIGTVVGAPMVIGWLLHHRIPGARYLAFAGGASYALYLLNYDLIRAFGIGGLALAIVGAGLSWALVERPILEWAHRRAAAWRMPKVADPAVALS